MVETDTHPAAETARVVDAGQLLDGTGDVLEDARVVMDEGRIAAVGPVESVDAPAEAAHDRYPDATLLPGLIDAHLHLQGVRSMNPREWVLGDDAHDAARATADLRKLVEAGFTTVRDLGSTTGIGLRRAVAAGEIPGPRIATSGPGLSQTGGHGDAHEFPHEWVVDGGMGIGSVVDGVAACRREARKRNRAGADCVKIMATGGVLTVRDEPDQPQFAEAELAAMVEEAHRADLPVAAHAQGKAGILRTLSAGVDTIEHGFSITPTVIERFRETGAVLVATLSINRRIVAEGAEHGVPEGSLVKMERWGEKHVESIRRAYEAGVPIATGTDFLGPELVPHGDNAMEARLLVEEIGMTEHEAIQANTSVAARATPVPGVGTVEAGTHGDLAVVERDPLADVTALEDVAATYVGGQLIA